MPASNEKRSAHGAPPDPKMKVSVWPPGHFLGSFTATGILGGVMSGLPIFSPRNKTLSILGFLGVATSVGVAFMGASGFKKHKTPVPHGYKVQTIVDTGMYAYSRNPIYLGMVGAVGSLGLALNSWWGPILQVYLWSIISCYVIPHEEAYLEDNFGKKYLDYKAKVSRWFLFF
jgi:protein-S-isoprenylcysteine O-methyltransferase Ste14